MRYVFFFRNCTFQKKNLRISQVHIEHVAAFFYLYETQLVQISRYCLKNKFVQNTCMFIYRKSRRTESLPLLKIYVKCKIGKLINSQQINNQKLYTENLAYNELCYKEHFDIRVYFKIPKCMFYIYMNIANARL